jgi:hypothetical protein
MKSFVPTALATSLLALVGAAQAAPDQAAGPVAPAMTQPLDLRPPNFFSPQWQRRLQGPTIDRTFDSVPMESIIVTPGEQAQSNLQVAPAGLGSLWWAALHPTQAWRIFLPVREGDEFNIDREIALAYDDPNSDCPGFPGTPNVRPVCH